MAKNFQKIIEDIKPYKQRSSEKYKNAKYLY